MLVATMLSAFSYSQSLFDPHILSMVGSLLVGIAGTLCILTIYPSILCQCNGVAAALIVVGTHVVKRIAVELFDGLIVGPAAVFTAFLLPFGLVVCFSFAERMGADKSRRTQATTPLCWDGWLLLAAAVVLTMLVDWTNGLNTWSASEVSAVNSRAWGMPAFAAELGLTVLLLWLSLRDFDRSQITDRCARMLVVSLSAFFTRSLQASVGDGTAGVLLLIYVSAVSTYVHGMLWVFVFDLIRMSGSSVYRIIGCQMCVYAVFLIVQTAITYWGLAPESALLDLGFLAVTAVIALSPYLHKAYKGRAVRPSTAGSQSPSLVHQNEAESEMNPETPLRAQLHERCANLAEFHALTTREAEMLELLACGCTRQTICDRLTLSEGTVKTHLTHLYAKMGVKSQQELLGVVFGLAMPTESE